MTLFFICIIYTVAALEWWMNILFKCCYSEIHPVCLLWSPPYSVLKVIANELRLR